MERIRPHYGKRRKELHLSAIKLMTWLSLTQLSAILLFLDHSELRRTRSYYSEPGTVCSMTAIDVEREYTRLFCLSFLCTVR